MDRVSQLRDLAGSSHDSSLDSTATPSEAYHTANESSKFFSLSDVDTTLDVDITPIKNSSTEESFTEISTNSDLLDSYRLGSHIEASKILSGGVDIFDDNSYDGNELVIDDNVNVEFQEDSKLTVDVKDSVEDTQDAEVAVGATNDTAGIAEDTNNEKTISVANNAISAPEETITAKDDTVNAAENAIKVPVGVAEDTIGVVDTVGTTQNDTITVAEITDCEAEDTVSVVEDTVEAAENAVTVAEDTVCASEDAVSVVENTVGSAERTINTAKNTVSAAENTASLVENIIGKAEDTITVAEVCAAEDIITVAEDTVCATDDNITVEDKSDTAAADTVSAKEDTVDAAHDTTDVAENTVVAVGDTITVADETVGDNQDTIVVAEETSGVAEVYRGTEAAKESKDTLVPIFVTPSEEREVVLPLNGELVSALDVGNGLYLYRQDGAELTVVQKLQTDNAQSDFRYLKVRETGGFLEVYEEIEVQVKDKAPGKKVAKKSMSHLHVNDISKAFCDSKRTTGTINKSILNKSSTSTSTHDTTVESEVKVKSDSTKSKPISFGSESRKSPLVETFTPIQHLTHIQEGIPSAKTVADLQPQPNCSPNMTKKYTDVTTERCDIKHCDISSKIENLKNVDTLHDVKLTTIMNKDSNLGKKNDKNEVDNKIIEPIIIDKPTTDTTITQITNNNPESTNNFAVEIKKNVKTNSTNVGLVSLPTKLNDNDKEPASKVELKLCPNAPAKDIKVASTENDKVKDIKVASTEYDKVKDIKVASTENDKINDINVASTENDKVKDIKVASTEYDKVKGPVSSAHSEISKLKTQKEECVAQDKSNLNKEVATLNKKTDENNLNSSDANVKNNVITSLNLNDTHNLIDTKSSNVDKSVIMPNTEKCQDLQTLKPLDADKTTTQDKLEDKIFYNKYITDALGMGKATTSLETLKSKEPVKAVDTEKLKECDNMPKPKLIQEEKAKSINNNNAVPFGQWTEANKQEYLNKIKESKSTVTTSTNQIKHSNDLNRRDVLKKIDSARQSSNLNSNLHKKDFTSLNKLPLKGEVNKTQYKPTPLKAEPALKAQSTLTNTMCDVNVSKVEGNNRTEMFNQDLIDKTIEGILMDKVPNVKPTQNVDSKRVISHEQVKETKKYPTMKSVSLLDDIEQKMNELHGKPLIERPGHKLPERFNQDFRNYQKDDSAVSTTQSVQQSTTSMTTYKEGSTISNKLPIVIMPSSNSKSKVTLGDEGHSEEEILEYEPVTGDSDIKQFRIASSPGNYRSAKSEKSSQSSKSQAATNDSKEINDIKNKEATSIITEKEFDKFARRNSITCENQLTVNFDSKQQPSIVKLGVTVNKSKSVITDTNNADAEHKNYPSKLQLAYNSVLTAKRQQGSPITDIEDQPVKVVFIESSNDFIPYKLNVEGNQLTNSKDIETLSSADSMDSDLNVIEQKTNDDSKIKKVKHQRKQVLTPVDTPDLELIEPRDLGLEVMPKRKRKTEDFKKIDARNNHLQRNMKSVPKKTYLLGRSNAIQEKLKTTLVDSNRDECLTKCDEAKESVVQSLPEFKDSSNNIDSLVMAAELLEKQPDVAKAIVETNTSNVSQHIITSKRGRGRPRKYPIQDGESSANDTTTSPQKRTKIYNKINRSESDSSETSDDDIIKENWTMGKINDNIVCPICNKLFRSENVVFKHVKHCTGPSPNRSESSANRSLRKRRLSYAKCDRSSSESEDSDVELGERTVSDNKKNISQAENKARKASVDEDNVIVIEDTPPAKKEPKDINKHPEDDIINKHSQKTSNSVLRVGNLVCEFCGKKFRQLSYLVNHKRLHQKLELKKPVEDEQNCDKKSVFECDVCHKEFRRLHHLVQHKISHDLKRQRKTSVDTKSTSTVITHVKDKDQNAGFRCEQCDKSFRKLHHLVEHRETHGGTNKLKTNPNHPVTDKTSVPPPQCTVCNKTFRKLHHLIEHKEQHMESNRCDNKKNTLLAKDIIHECPLCYMVFPNEHSLEKHTIICERKKRQAAAKKAKEALKRQEEMAAGDIQSELPPKDIVDVEDDKICDKEKIDIRDDQVKAIVNELDPKPLATKRKSDEDPDETPAKVKKCESITENKVQVTKEESKTVKDLERPPQEVLKEEVADIIDLVATNVSYSKDSVKIKPNITETDTKKPLFPERDVEMSDDDDIRYMLNPDYKRKVFTKVRAKKRNSLQIERPGTKNLRLRSISLPFAPSKAQISETVPSSEIAVSSDEGEIKYSFPRTRKDSTNTEKHSQRKSQSEKRRSVGGIAKRKLLGNGTVTKKSPKKRAPEAGHRCDCGQLFGSAALLARHAVLTHTPPRVRRRRSPPPLLSQPARVKRDADVKPEAKHVTKELEARRLPTAKTPRKSKITSDIPKKSTTSKPSAGHSGKRGTSRTLANK